MAETRLIATLLRLLDHARRRERALVAGLSDAERSASGTIEGWSAKDLIAHITAWHGTAAMLVTAALHGDTPARPAGIDEINARTFAENQAKSWEQVLAEADQAIARLSGLLPQLHDEDLTLPGRYPWRRGQALAPALARPIYWHPMMHVGQYYAQRGDAEAAGAIRADLAETADALAAWPELRGNTLYMLAGLSALLGQTAEARAALGEALALAPLLVEWSKRDPNLQPLLQEE